MILQEKKTAIGAEGKESAFVVAPCGKGDVTESHVPWKTKKGLPFVASGIIYRGFLFAAYPHPR